MSTPAAIPVGGSLSIPLRFEMTIDEMFRIGPQLYQNRRVFFGTRWMAVIPVVLAIFSATRADWLGAALFGVLGAQMWWQFGLMKWWLRKLLRGGTHADLELDEHGIRGVLEYYLSGKEKPDVKRIGYSWRQLRKAIRLPDYLYLEFHGGGGAIIPVTAFDDTEDLERCEAWAENGLAQQRQKSALVRVPA
jgi:hypothetical protein